MRSVSGYFVPEIDEHCLSAVLNEVGDLGVSLDLCLDFRTVIQAGGNVGVYPLALSQRFKVIHTVEPDVDNYEALLANCANARNIVSRRAAFGKAIGTAAIDRVYPDNIGAHQIKQGNEFPVITIDSLGVTDCDFLQLDVEGSEHDALLGAIATIEASWPVITLELKGLGLRYGYSDEDTIAWLKDMGYEIADRVNRDVIFKYRKA